MADRVYRFGAFQLSPSRRTLLLDGQVVGLRSRAFDLLVALLERAGSLAAKSELMDAVWPGLAVEENNLTVQLAALRRALAAGAPPETRFIETVAGRGYRFVAPVEIAAATDVASPAALAGSETPHNLPAPLARLVGRVSEVAALRAALRRARLVTVAGPGGIGKTSVAVAAARAALPDLPDGAWLVELAAHADPNMVPAAIAGVLGIATRRGATLAQVAAALRDQRALLVLDNCEHLAAGAAHAAEALLRACPALRVLATGREPLGCEGEEVHRLSPLGLPDAADAGSAAEALRAPAVELLADRAAAALGGGFALTDAEAPAAAEICRRLDGIPLAIELAAARLRTLTLGQVRDRLNDRLGLLVGGRRTAAPRQRTLRAALDWSHDLLDGTERVLLRRLSVFSGSFCAEAAAAVADGGQAGTAAMEPHLDGLADRSWVVPCIGGPEPRYALLETTRQYAAERMAEAGEPDARPRLAAWLVSRLTAAQTERETADELAWAARYGPDADDVRASLGWAFGAGGDRALGVSLASLAPPLWQELTLAAEHDRWVELALSAVDGSTSPAEAARLWLARTHWHTMGDPEPLPAAERAAALFRSAGDALGEARAQLAAAFALLSGPGTVGDAVRRLERAEALLGNGGAAAGHTAALSRRLRAIALWYAGDAGGAWRCFDHALEAYEDLGSRGAWAGTMGSLAQRQFAEGRAGDAEATVRRALRSLPTARRRSATAIHLTGLLASYRIAQGDLRGAAGLAREALQGARSLGLRREFAWGAERCAAVGEAASPEEAARLFGFSDGVYAATGRVRPETTVPRYEAALGRLRGRLGPARLAALLAEGARLREEEAVRRAVALAGAVAVTTDRGAPEGATLPGPPGQDPGRRGLSA